MIKRMLLSSFFLFVRFIFFLRFKVVKVLLMHPWHQLVGQSAQRLSSCPCRPPHDAHAAQATQNALAWPWASYG